ncbi:CBS domain-containing protein [Streptomyces abikoensis]|uniref:Putative CBS domain-containing protein n=1 Tax=Streptomyces albireticuli TaxID=1940 RepID=A0A1Z2KXF4_9ACTN|nr:CBS domain-containing protein [Streptomyces albireticuli]ARZ66724.1 putative CBS domain-containing protein [Streptomyces albireticuli]
MYRTQRTVSDVMTQTVVAVSGDAPYKQIARTLAEWKVSAVPVLAGEGRVIGVVSEADLLSKEEYKGREPTDVARPEQLGDLAKAGARTAEDLMSTPAVTVHADATVAEAARIMARKGVKRLPVVDAEGMLAGIVSRADLLKVYLRSDEDIAQEVRDEVIARLFPHRSPTVEVQVTEGVVTLSGHLPDATMVPFVARLVRAAEGVVNVDLRLDGPTS